jgi:uncharacterized protein YjdB/uncharacterized protein YcfL
MKKWQKLTSWVLAAFMMVGMIGGNRISTNAETVATDTDATVVEETSELEEMGTSEELDADEVEAQTKEYNFAKLLQYSLYFYDANMCGNLQGESLTTWRSNCHTKDTFTYNGKTYDATGGFHDAGDHVKFGLPMAYSMTMLGLGYYEFGEAYDELGQTGHLQTITDYGCDYFKKCTVLDASGNVQAFCYQVGTGQSDHDVWSSPESQTTARVADSRFIATSSNPATDIVCQTAAALAVNYINFGNAEDLKYAKALFAFADKNSKKVGAMDSGNSGVFYNSTSYEDDYCMAAAMLYLAAEKDNNTSDMATYKSKYYNYGNNMYCGWAQCWDDTKMTACLYAPGGDSTRLNNLNSYLASQTTSTSSYYCLNSWGSARYNVAMQFMGLAYDNHTNSSKYLKWSTYQMSVILGNNSTGKNLICGYNSNSPQYPHHRAASGMTGSVKDNVAYKYVLTGALVGGPTSSDFSTYEDKASNYTTNEVACDYNAALPGAAAALYLQYKNSTAAGYQTQQIDSNYYYEAVNTTDNSGGVTVSYRTHVQTYGWQNYVSNGKVAGTTGQSKRLEGINIKVSGNNNLGIQYTTHCQTYGWLPWSSDGDMSGTEGESKRLEAIKIQLTGSDADKYDVYYRVHAQSYGWLGWAKNGEPAGTAGYSKRLEGIQIVIVEKGKDFNTRMSGISSVKSAAYIAKSGTSPVLGGTATSATNPQISGTNTPNVTYRTHVQTYGWQGWKYNGDMSGTSGQSKRLESIQIKLTNKTYSGGIQYKTHIQSYGWTSWNKDGESSGTVGQAKRLEAIQIQLTGEMANHYDVYYRVHAQSYGWLGWAKNGESAGTAGLSKRLEGIEIVLVPKGSAAPGSTANHFIEK